MPGHPKTSAAVSREVSQRPAEQNITRAMNTCPGRDSLSQCSATRRRQRLRLATRRRGAELSRPNAQRQERPDSGRLDPEMCKERDLGRLLNAAHAVSWATQQKAAEASRRRCPHGVITVSSPAVRRLQRGCEGRPLECSSTQPASPAPSLPSTFHTRDFDETRNTTAHAELSAPGSGRMSSRPQWPSVPNLRLTPQVLLAWESGGLSTLLGAADADP